MAWGVRNFAVASSNMMQVIKELRSLTGAPVVDCKNALQDPEVDGDLEKAFDWLRKKGISTAIKKSDRKASEGLIGVRVSEDGTQAAIVEVRWG